MSILFNSVNQLDSREIDALACFRRRRAKPDRIKGLERFMKKLAILAFAAAFFMQQCRAIELPKPPDGFTWQEIPELKAAFLKPNGWYFKQETQNGTLAYFITRKT
jgi:hypothetical protein